MTHRTIASAQNFETIAEAAARHRVSGRTIRRRIADGTLTGYRFGPTSVRLNPAEVDALLRRITAGDAA
jgi:excisionase family DNA binding protein